MDEIENAENEGTDKIDVSRFLEKNGGKISIKERIRRFFSNPKKRVIFIAVVGLVVIAAVGTGFYFLNSDKKTVENKEEKNETPVAKTEVLYPAPLTGVPVGNDAANRHPLAVIVENHPDARPQAGLDKADIVYEAIAEGGITRFMAVFGSKEADKVGPVRSARTFFVDWSRGYSAYLAHVGGNIDALDQIKAEKVLDLDQFAFSTPYWRERSANLATEHTMYTDTVKLREQAGSNKYSGANNFNVLKFKDDPVTDAEKAALPEAQKVSIGFSSAPYDVYFQYDKNTNSYKRFLAGTPHTDQMTKQQINPKNIIAMTVARKPTVTRINESGWDMTTIGSGPAKIFLDGKTILGSWKKTGKTDREIFYDQAGNEIIFNRGQFWIAVVPPEAVVKAE